MILNREQVDLLDAEGVESALKQFHKAYKVDKPITAEVWADIDEISSTLLYLEDRETYLKHSANAIEANKSRWGNK